jgi:hypothetical protein
MWQDGPLSAYIPTAGTSGSNVNFIGARSGMRALKGPLWTMEGGVRQSVAVSTTPARIGTGPFIASYAYYRTPSTLDPIDISTFSACAVVVPSADTTTTQVIANNHQASPVNGWQAVFVEIGVVAYYGTSGNITQAKAWTSGVPNLMCWGANAANSSCFVRQNKGTVASAVGSCPVTVEPSGYARIGVHHDLLVPFLGTVVEYWVSSETPSQTVFDRVAAEVEARGGITLP